MRFTLDTNVLAYAIDPEDPRAERARRIVSAALTADCLLTNQVLGEFLNVARRKKLTNLEGARQTVRDWRLLFPVAPTSTDHLIAAGTLAERYRLQFWDSVVIEVARTAGVAHFLTEDMQDGAIIDGVRLLNPFNPANAELLDLLLTPAP